MFKIKDSSNLLTSVAKAPFSDIFYNHHIVISLLSLTSLFFDLD